MSDMLDWAKREVAIASKRERGDKPEDEWDYGVACYDSALKAFESLLGDNHSGFSIHITKGILNRLIDGKPLTPIEDIEDVWNKCYRGNGDDKTTYQCKRMSSLFKDVYDDGKVVYKDINRYCDPPYLITVASYNENGGWGEQAERDLLAKLDELTGAGVRFALSNVLESKGKENTILKKWAEKYTVHYLDHTYSNCSYHKKDKQSKDVEVLITNY